MADTLFFRAADIQLKLRCIEFQDQAKYDELIRLWNISVPLVESITRGLVRSLTEEGHAAFKEFEQEVKGCC